MADALTAGLEARFEAYVEGLMEVVGHADRARPLVDYCRGLLLPGERKSVEPMAAVTAPARVSAQHQSLLHFVGEASWSDDRMLAKVRELVLPAMVREDPIQAWIIDDTGFGKKGRHSVGVAHQYCGELGHAGNCQVAVTLSIANHDASLPVDYRLYLPQEWANDPLRRRKAKVPDEVVFETKPAIALSQIRAACARDIPRGVVLMDGAYGCDMALRTAIAGEGLSYVVGLPAAVTVWGLDREPLPPGPWCGRGRRPTRLRRDAAHRPFSVEALARALPADAWHTVTWREGTNAALASRFARTRVRPAHRDDQRQTPHPQEWLLIEWPAGEAAPTRYWLSNLPEDVPLARMVDLAKLRWRIERDYQELKQEVGLGHYEGRGWRGFHHHATLCIAAYGFLVRERAAFPPSGAAAPRLRQEPPVPGGHRPRGTPDPARAPRPDLDRNAATPSRHRSRPTAPALPLLRTAQ